MNDVQNCGVFEGHPIRKMFSCSLPQLTADKYKMAGQLLQWSIQHGGPGIPVLLPDLYYHMVGVNCEHALQDTDITDVSVRDVINKVSDFDTMYDLRVLADCSP